MAGWKNRKFRGVNEVTFFVEDVREATWWIEDLTGEKPVFVDKSFTKFIIGSTEVGIHSSDEKTRPGVAGQVAYWEVDDMDSVVVDFLSLGGCLYREPITGIDKSRVCQVMDLFGNVWGLLEKGPKDQAKYERPPQ